MKLICGINNFKYCHHFKKNVTLREAFQTRCMTWNVNFVRSKDVQ